jgi:hypothetical protein
VLLNRARSWKLFETAPCAAALSKNRFGLLHAGVLVASGCIVSQNKLILHPWGKTRSVCNI